MATKKKKKKKKGHKLHGAALAAWRKSHGITKAGHRKEHHGHHAKKKKKKKAHRRACPFCGHHAQHKPGVGCLHHDASGRFCPCKMAA